ncbi:hypothetical protein VD659_08670 [Herbiconiux sp. 11R-BC]|uniref:hypothetical protein n=1 Tax=Herbiconiux sp. 11R-BC TaxID=3111637 RepID=UPI003C0F9F33
MAEMTRNQAQGQMAENEATGHLMRLGFSLNSLTGSDFGWDLHGQMPETPLVLTGMSALTAASWELSARAVHVQVKSMRAARYPQLDRRTVSAWLQASLMGSPTFVMIVRANVRDTAERHRFMTPGDLDRWLRRVRDLRPPRQRITRDETRLLDTSQLPLVLDLWGRFPLLMHLVADRLPIGAQNRREDVEDAITYLIAEFAHSYLARFYPHSGADTYRLTSVYDSISSAFYAGAGDSWSWPDESTRVVHAGDLLVNTRNGGNEWTDPAIPLHALTASADEAPALDDVRGAAEILGRYVTLGQ